MSTALRAFATGSGRRAGLIALLCLFVFGQAQSGVHHARVRHELCELHGELAHGEDHHHHAAESAAHDRHHHDGDCAEELEGPLLTRVEHGGEDGHDEHCRVPTPRQLGRMGPSCETPQPRPPVATPAVPDWRSQRRASCIEIVLFAPKQSPPRAA